MYRRQFLQLVGVVVLAPSLPEPSPWFIYRGYRFRKDIRRGCFQLYSEEVIRGEKYRFAYLIDPEVYDKCRNIYCDSIIVGFERIKANGRI